jgi:hypothetical protein
MELYQEDFEAMLAAATTPGDISKYFEDGYSWEFDTHENQDAAVVKAAERAFELVSTVASGVALDESWQRFSLSSELDTKLFEKLITLVSNKDELARIFDHYIPESMGVRELFEIRNHIRKIFDKADELGLEVMVNLRD